jgi:hypothetical protein
MNIWGWIGIPLEKLGEEGKGTKGEGNGLDEPHERSVSTYHIQSAIRTTSKAL